MVFRDPEPRYDRLYARRETIEEHSDLVDFVVDIPPLMCCIIHAVTIRELVRSTLLTNVSKVTDCSTDS